MLPNLPMFLLNAGYLASHSPGVQQNWRSMPCQVPIHVQRLVPRSDTTKNTSENCCWMLMLHMITISTVKKESSRSRVWSSFVLHLTEFLAGHTFDISFHSAKVLSWLYLSHPHVLQVKRVPPPTTSEVHKQLQHNSSQTSLPNSETAAGCHANLHGGFLMHVCEICSLWSTNVHKPQI